MNGATEALVTIITLIIGVAIVAVLVSSNSQTSAVIQSFGSVFTSALGVAEAPVTGQSTTSTLTTGLGNIL